MSITSSPYRYLQNLPDESLQINGRFQVEVDKIPFNFSIHGDSAIVSFQKIADGYEFLKFMKKSASSNGKFLKRSLQFLDKFGITLYLQNRHFALAGPNSNILWRGIALLLGLNLSNK